MIAVLITSFGGSPAFAQATAKPSAVATPKAAAEEEADQLAPTEAQLHFANQYVKAVNGKDVKALRQMIAPETLACYTPRTEPYLTNWLTRQTMDTIKEPYTIKVEKRDEEDMPRSALITMPVAPTHQLDIIGTINGKEQVMGRPIVYENGRWYETAPCPTDLGMEQFTNRNEKARRDSEHMEQLYANLKDPLKSDLKNLISQNKIAEACTKYAAAEKTDFKTGCRVVKRLAASMGITIK